MLETADRPTPRSRLEQHRDFLWGLCYRMTGVASDAEDLVQETFLRALERPPPDTEAAWRPWLVRVAMNLSRDQLRRRRRRKYFGQWLPSPVETSIADARSGTAQRDPDDEAPDVRYDRMESASFAFLVALEALTPAQRAVLLLRDAFDHTVAETAEVLEMSAANIRTTHHRARKRMEGYDRNRRPPTADLDDEVRAMLERMVTALATRNFEAARALLAQDVRAISDGGGVTFAARNPVRGRDKIAKLYMNLAERSSAEARFEIRTLNGVPAIVGEDPNPKPPNAPRFVFRVELDRAGLVREIHSVLAPAKLSRVGALT